MFAAVLKAEPVKDQDLPGNIQPITQTCTGCLWRRPDGVSCDAFPEGIPKPILLGAYDHTAYYDDGTVSDEGLTFYPA